MREQDLYGGVARFLKREFDCLTVEQTTGPRYGNIDVVGLRYIHNLYGGTAELIAIEVKLSKAVFLKSIGQALGYSLMADRCYLAVYRPEGFTQSETEMSAQLNIGLIQIRDRDRCRVILSSPQHRPLRHHKLALMRKLGYVECALCQRPVKRKHVSRYYLDHPSAHSATNVVERRYICPDCIPVLPTNAVAAQ